MSLHRPTMMQRLRDGGTWDVCVIGGGATGLGIAFEAASSGLDTLLIERADFAKGTSSRSTKLLHGGVRYLQQGRIGLVKEALLERDRILQNAEGHVQAQSFVIPVKQRWKQLYYGTGLLLYDLLAGKRRWGRTTWVSKREMEHLFPTLREAGMVGGLRYSDGKFDDVGLALSIAKAAARQGAALLNHCNAVGFHKKDGRIDAVEVEDGLTGNRHRVEARVVVNACGPFSDAVNRLDDDGHRDRIRPSQGIHLVFDRNILPGKDAVLIPKTDDGRVLFAVPWLGKVLVGTTDTALEKVVAEPVALQQEIDFVIDHANRHLGLSLGPEDVRSVFAGLRPLVKGGGGATSDLSRSHQIEATDSGLVSVRGGKWTTYRKMAEDTLAFIQRRCELDFTPANTADSPIVQGLVHDRSTLPDADADLEAAVREAVETEMCVTVEDFLARRYRILLLDARQAIRRAETVATALANVQGFDGAWAEEQTRNFKQLAAQYLPTNTL